MMIKQMSIGHSERVDESECSTCFNIFMLFSYLVELYRWTFWWKDQDKKKKQTLLALYLIKLIYAASLLFQLLETNI